MEIKLAQECWVSAEKARTSIDPDRICSFGIPILDDALTGILQNDLIVIGADSGVGKSEIALDIAIHNASHGRTVALYFLEGGAEEAINRIRWKMIRRKFFQGGYSGIDLDYTKWRMNKITHPLIKELDDICLAEFNNTVKNKLHMYSFEDGFTIDMLMNSIGVFANYLNPPTDPVPLIGYSVDLLIIDHLQYFSLTSDSNQFMEMTQILMKVKQITVHHKIPVVLISPKQSII